MHLAGAGGMFHVIGRGFLFVRALGARMFLIVQSGLGPGFLTVTVTHIHAGHAAAHGAQKAMMIGDMATDGTGGTIFETSARFGLRCCE